MPLGDGSRSDEGQGNLEVAFMAKFARRVLDAGGFFSFEQPKMSYMLSHPDIKQLIDDFQHIYECVYVDQCAYGLGSPAGASPKEYWKKPTNFHCFRMPLAASLHRECRGKHIHTHVQDRICVYGRAVARSKLAAAYPKALCEAYVGAVGASWTRAHGAQSA
jgi:hypothetical protein